MEAEWWAQIIFHRQASIRRRAHTMGSAASSPLGLAQLAGGRAGGRGSLGPTGDKRRLACCRCRCCWLAGRSVGRPRTRRLCQIVAANATRPTPAANSLTSMTAARKFINLCHRQAAS